MCIIFAAVGDTPHIKEGNFGEFANPESDNKENKGNWDDKPAPKEKLGNEKSKNSAIIWLFLLKDTLIHCKLISVLS